MSREILIARIREPRREEHYLEFFEFEGTILELIEALVYLDREISRQNVFSRGFFLFPREVGREIVKRYVVEDENLRQASAEAVLEYYPNFTNIEINKLLGTTEYMVARIKLHLKERMISEIQMAYQEYKIHLIYFEKNNEVLQGSLVLRSSTPDCTVYNLIVRGGIKQKERMREATFENLVELVKKLYSREQREKAMLYLVVN